MNNSGILSKNESGGLKKLRLFVACSALAVILFSCTGNKLDQHLKKIEKDQLRAAGIAISYPGDSTLFPPEIPAPGFIWTDSLSGNNKWYIRLTTKDGKNLFSGIVKSNKWRPDSTSWEKYKATAAHEPVSFSVASTKKLSSGYATAKINFSFSIDSVQASLFFRAVPLPFGYAVKNVQEIEWYVGQVSGGMPHRVLTNIPVCANCHSFSKTGILAMDVDYANDKGSYIIAPVKDTIRMSPDKIITWSDYRREDGTPTYGLLSQISPDGKYVLSTVKDRSVFVAQDNLMYSQLFFPVKGIIAYYNRETGKYSELPGASDRKFVQSNPNWSPDGREVIFARTGSYMTSRIEKSESVLLNQEDVSEFTVRHKEFKFDLYRLAFNGGKGGTATPVPGASNNHKSNFFARYSPDGKWIVFCQTENYMLLQPDSRLYIMPSQDGTPHLMNCNTPNMNSWHSWSPNSKWLVFSSKLRGPYTQLYITHIDDNGNDSPPVLLENLMFDKRAANIPEFLDNKRYSLTTMLDDFSDNAMYYNRLATENIRQHDYIDALKNANKAIEKDSTCFDAYKNKLYLSMMLGQSHMKQALMDRVVLKRLMERQRIQHPEDKTQLPVWGDLNLYMEDFDAAIRDGKELAGSGASAFRGNNLIAESYMQKGEPEKAIPYLRKMQEIQPDNIQVPFTLAVLYKDTKQPGKARELLESLIKKNPDEARFFILRAKLLIAENKNQEALSDYTKAISLDSGLYNGFSERAALDARTSSPDQARRDYDQALTLLSTKISRNPQDAPLYINRAEVMEQSGNTQDALKEYETYLKKWPLNEAVLRKVAQLYNYLKNYPKAIDAYTQIVENFSVEPRILVGRGLVYLETNNASLALKDFDSAIGAEEKGNSYLYSDYYFRSGAKEKLGDKAGAKNDLQTALDLLKVQQTKRALDATEINLLSNIQARLNQMK